MQKHISNPEFKNVNPHFIYDWISGHNYFADHNAQYDASQSDASQTPYAWTANGALPTIARFTTTAGNNNAAMHTDKVSIGGTFVVESAEGTNFGSTLSIYISDVKDAQTTLETVNLRHARCMLPSSTGARHS